MRVPAALLDVVAVFTVVGAVSLKLRDFFNQTGEVIMDNHQVPPLTETSNATSVAVRTLTGNIKERPRDSLPTIRVNGLINQSETESYASPITLTPAVANVPVPVDTATPVPSAVISHMVQQNVPNNIIFPIVTKLKPDAWELALRHAGILNEFNDVPKGLKYGFLCGLENFSLARSFIPENHYTSKEDEDFIVTKYNDEIALNRISHGYEPQVFFLLLDISIKRTLTYL